MNANRGRRIALSAAACAAVIGGLAWAGTTAVQAQAKPWFGLSPPAAYDLEAVGARIRAAEFAPLSYRAMAGAKPAISGAEVKGYSDDIVGISEADRKTGAPFWGRIAGLPGDLAMSQYVEKRFRGFGLTDVHIDNVPLPPQWVPKSWSLTLVGAPELGPDYNFPSAYPAPASVDNDPKTPAAQTPPMANPVTPAAGMEADLVYVGAGAPADLIGRDVRGKAVLIEGRGRAVAERLAGAGAAFLVMITDVPNNAQSVVVGSGSARIPSFTLAAADGRYLVNLVGRAAAAGKTLRVRGKLDAEVRNGLQTHNVVGVVRGRSDEWIIVTCHHDSYFWGAIDNSTGCATMLALARHVACGAKPKRSYMFVADGAHHGNFTGSRDLTQRYKSIFDKTLVLINAEHTSGQFTGAGYTPTNTEIPKGVDIYPANPLLLKSISAAIDRNGVVVRGKVGVVPVGDALPYYRAGYPVLQIIEVSSWYYHSLNDIPPLVSPAGLARASNAYVDFLRDLDGLTMAAVRAADGPKNVPYPRIGGGDD